MALKIIFIIFVFLMFITMHEITHYEIFRSNDCKNISFSLRKTGIYTTAICPTDSQDLPNNINEIVGYNIMPMLILIFAVIFLKEDKGEI